MNARQLAWIVCAGMTLGAACQQSQGARAAARSSGEEACAREPGEPPQVGDGVQQTQQRPCASSHSVMGESAKRPEEL